MTCRSVLYSIVLVSVLALPFAAKAQDPVFKSSYAGALVITPINTNILFAPQQDFQPLVSGSIEYSLPRTGHIGLAIGGGYYPYFDRDEILGQFGIRRFFRETSPVGAYWEMVMQGGAAILNGDYAHADPLFGLGLRLGSLRASRFGDLAFEYGGGPTVVLIGGETQLRMSFFFGLGWLLGHDMTIVR